MNTPSPLAERLRKAFEPNPRGVVGVADELLGACREQRLRLEWRAGACHVRPVGTSGEEPIDVPLPKSVFRALLARFAALCNERKPDSVSPYGGEGELAVGTDRAEVFGVTFTNTPDEQRLEVGPVQKAKSTVPALAPTAAPNPPSITSPGSA
jgi:hypothetical protein